MDAAAIGRVGVYGCVVVVVVVKHVARIGRSVVIVGSQVGRGRCRGDGGMGRLQNGHHCRILLFF